MLNLHKWFKLSCYGEKHHPMKHPYPTYKIVEYSFGYFDSAEDAESLIRLSPIQYNGFYCYTISELPMYFRCEEGESFSERIYLPDGQLWSVRDYSFLFPQNIPAYRSELEFDNGSFDNDLYSPCIFEGRTPEEIRFKKGDIIEILCYTGNNYWSKNSVELAIVVDTPPSKEEMKKRMDYYLKTSHDLTGDKGFDLGVMFNALDDVYTVIPAYLPTDTAPQNLTDYCPTHCAMKPRYEASPRTQQRLAYMLNRCIDHIKYE